MPQLNLRRHYPTEVDYWATEDAHSQIDDVDVQVKAGVGHNVDNQLNWRVNLRVIFSAKAGETVVSKGAVSFVGFFDVSQDVAAEERMKYVGSNGISILYSATREVVANLSARRPNGLVTLPPAGFQKVVEGMKGQPSKQISSATV